MTGSRRSQPYRQGARVPSPALDAMKRGRGTGGINSADVVRKFQAAAGKRKGRQRPDRPVRPDRPPRPPR